MDDIPPKFEKNAPPPLTEYLKANESYKDLPVIVVQILTLEI